MTPIEDFDVPNRAYFALKRAGVVHIEDVAAMTMDEVGRIPNVGATTLADIQYGLIAMNMNFRDENSTPVQSRQILRPQQWLSTYTQRYPGLWQRFGALRASRGVSGQEISWPDWCYLPLGGAQVALTGRQRISPQESVESAISAALGAWRLTKGVYRFHPATMDSLWETPITDDLPDSIFEKLPEWCVYIEVGRQFQEAYMHGFFVHLEWDVNLKRRELRFIWDWDERLAPLSIHLTGNVREGIEQSNRQGFENARRAARTPGQMAEIEQAEKAISMHMGVLSEDIGRLVSLVMYLCASNAQLPEPKIPGGLRRHPKNKTEMAAEEISIYQVGYRIGRLIRGALAEEPQHREGGGGGGGEKAPHVRRAHWHTYVTGPRKDERGNELEPDQRKRELKWLPPIAVKMDQPELLTPLVRPVR